MKNLKISFLLLVLATMFLSIIVTACTETEAIEEEDEFEVGKDQTMVFADAGWDSIRLHNNIAGIIIQEGFGLEFEEMLGSTPATMTGHRNGEIHIYMENWHATMGDLYDDAIDSGDITEVSVNFDDNMQGFYVPTYVIEGDPERGIEPMAPDLKAVEDLPKYWELFEDPEDPSKGRIVGAPSTWTTDITLQAKYENYSLDETFNYFSPGSETTLATSIVDAYESGNPWVGYYWEPTWIMGQYDMTLLEEPEYSDELWEDGYQSAFPTEIVTITVHKDLPETNPGIVNFLSNYSTSSDLTSQGLAYMQENNVESYEAAKWFLVEHEEVWRDWVPEEISAKVLEAIS